MGNWQEVFPNIERASSLEKNVGVTSQRKKERVREKEGRRKNGGAFTPENLAETKDRRMEERSLISSPHFFDYESRISVYEVRIFYETPIVP